MVLYYRVAGIIACFGLAMNMLLIVGCMVLIKAAFTLPGLAGLVLTVGMSVDANVLIYERIREELKRGAALRMAIRNGFDRATTTIIDSNVTNLITGIVIYKIAPDNVKGFGITLVLGIAMSIFVAVFLTRIVFDVARAPGLDQDAAHAAVHRRNEHRLPRAGGACALPARWSLSALAWSRWSPRRDDLFDIDFTGGSSVQFVLEDDQAMELRRRAGGAQQDAAGRQEPVAGANRRGEERATHYTVTTINDNVGEVEKIVADGVFREAEELPGGRHRCEAAGCAAAPTRPERWRSAACLPGLPSPMSYISLLQAAPRDAQDDRPTQPRMTPRRRRPERQPRDLLRTRQTPAAPTGDAEANYGDW